MKSLLYGKLSVKLNEWTLRLVMTKTNKVEENNVGGNDIFFTFSKLLLGAVWKSIFIVDCWFAILIESSIVRSVNETSVFFSFSLLGCLLRPVGLSLPYLLFLFYLPFVPVASLRSFKGNWACMIIVLYFNLLILSFIGHTGYFLKIQLFFSVILCLVQVAFQILLAVLGNNLIQKCEFLELLLRHVGLVRLDNLE